MQNKILEIQDLSKVYHTKAGEIKAIDQISFDVQEGEFLAIVGTSGCGKSSLLSILAGLEKQSSGKIQMLRDNVTIGYMLQEDALFPWLTILENALLGLRIQKKDTPENIAYVKSLLELYGLEEFMEKKPAQLSGGMKQRVG